ncbi:hypothetical protein VNO77_22295 [Canavalia gladiata]|uniref:Uncharacterized protein n=1 Tax=Canavalia gladiata TaxID=3824 RepID=A0AAN9L7I2_CANGL
MIIKVQILQGNEEGNWETKSELVQTNWNSRENGAQTAKLDNINFVAIDPHLLKSDLLRDKKQVWSLVLDAVFSFVMLGIYESQMQGTIYYLCSLRILGPSAALITVTIKLIEGHNSTYNQQTIPEANA